MDNTGIRILGAVLVVISCSGMGFFMAGQWGERLKTMEHLRKMIFLLKGEIVYARSALPESFDRTGKKGGGEIGDLFIRVAERMEGQRGEPFYDIWQEEIDKLPKAFCLSKEDRQSLKGLGASWISGPGDAGEDDSPLSGAAGSIHRLSEGT